MPHNINGMTKCITVIYKYADEYISVAIAVVRIILSSALFVSQVRFEELIEQHKFGVWID